MEEELEKLRGQQVPIKTKTGGRFLDYVFEVRPGVLILATNADGSGRRTVVSVDSIESFTTGGAAAAGGAAASGAKPKWMEQH